MSTTKLPGWKELPEGAVVRDAGNTMTIDVSGWRVFKPVIIDEKCTRCRLCWIYCPDGAILEVIDEKARMGKRYEVDYMHCKGCGICWRECPVNAIEWVPEER